MHIFLTGSIQIGKSTALRKALSVLGIPFGGFETFFVGNRAAPDSLLFMQRAGMPHRADDESVVARFHEGHPTALPERFDAIGCRLLREARAKAPLILMDECGRLERNALLFQQEVLLTLDGQTPVLGVVRQGAGGWTERIMAHKRVRILTVTDQNRDALPALLAQHIRKMEVLP